MRIKKEFTGSGWVFWLWIFLFFPVGVIYYFMNYNVVDEGERKKQEKLMYKEI